MKVLVLGAGGFIGRHLVTALQARGHGVIRGVHGPAAKRGVSIDYMRDLTSDVWAPRVREMDVVVNAVGLIAESRGASFDNVHIRAPAALAAACALHRVALVHLSAAGADAGARSAYHRSKRDGEEAILDRLPGAVIAQPGLVFGADGESARFFTGLASLPVLVVPTSLGARIQPLHIDDLIAALVTLIEAPPRGGRYTLVGPEALTWPAWFTLLRAALGLPRARQIELPLGLDYVLRLGAALFATGHLVNADTLGMLRRDNIGSACDTTLLIGKPPRMPGTFIPPEMSADRRLAAELGWLIPIARGSLAAVWWWSALVSAGLYPLEHSLALLAAVGLQGSLAGCALAAGVVIDATLGTLTLWQPRRWLWAVQAMVIGAYTLVISVALPAFWLHPFGPLLKNLPMLALLWIVARADRDRQR